MTDLPEYKYTESDMDTLRAVLRGCQSACQDLRNLLKAMLPNYLEYRGWSPVDLSDEELVEAIKLALDSPAQKEWERHEWVNKKRFDELNLAYKELVTHHANHHKRHDAHKHKEVSSGGKLTSDIREVS